MASLLPTTTATPAELVAAHWNASTELADLLEARGQTSQQAIISRSQAYRSAASTGISATAARDLASDAAAQFDQETANLTGQIDALRAILNHLEFAMKYGTTGG